MHSDSGKYIDIIYHKSHQLAGYYAKENGLLLRLQHLLLLANTWIHIYKLMMRCVSVILTVTVLFYHLVLARSPSKRLDNWIQGLQDLAKHKRQRSILQNMYRALSESKQDASTHRLCRFFFYDIDVWQSALDIMTQCKLYSEAQDHKEPSTLADHVVASSQRNGHPMYTVRLRAAPDSTHAHTQASAPAAPSHTVQTHTNASTATQTVQKNRENQENPKHAPQHTTSRYRLALALRLVMHIVFYALDLATHALCIAGMALANVLGLFLPNNGRKIYASFEKAQNKGLFIVSFPEESPIPNYTIPAEKYQDACLADCFQPTALTHDPSLFSRTASSPSTIASKPSMIGR